MDRIDALREADIELDTALDSLARAHALATVVNESGIVNLLNDAINEVERIQFSIQES